MEAIYNGAPMHISRGFEVAKQPPVAPQGPSTPIHYPHIFGFAEKGELMPQTVTNNFNQLFGHGTLRPQGKWLTHNSVLAKILAGQGNPFKFQRLISDDAKQSTIVTWMARSKDAAAVPVARGWNREGDSSGPSAGDTIQQHLVAFYNEPLVIPTGQSMDEAVAALHTRKEAVILTVYGSAVEFEATPVFFQSQTHGKWGDRTGYTIDTLDAKTTDPLDVEQALRIGGRLHTIRFWEKPEGSSTPTAQMTRQGQLEAKFSLLEGAFDPALNHDYSMVNVLKDSYTQLNPSLPKYPTYAPYDRFVFFPANYASVIKQLHEEEKARFDDGTDPWLISPFTARDINGDAYYTFRVVEPNDAIGSTKQVIRWGHVNVNYLQGGEDGDTSNEAFDKLVRQKFENFGNEFMQGSREKYPISVVYDTGFELPTKEIMSYVTARRRDVAVGFSTHIHGAGILTPQEEQSIARAIMAAARMYPESSYFGTPFSRGFLVVGSAEYAPEELPWRISQMAHYVDKLAAYAGSGRGILVPEADFSTYPGNRVTVLKNLSNPYRKDEVRVEEWEYGMNVLLPYDEHSYHNPGFFTMFSDDTTPMKSVVNMFIAIAGEKAARTTWHDFAGSDKYSKGVLRDMITGRVMELMDARRFDGRLNNLEVETIFTKDDLRRGYSWSTRLKMPLAMPMNVGTFDLLIDRLNENINPETFS